MRVNGLKCPNCNRHNANLDFKETSAGLRKQKICRDCYYVGPGRKA